MATAGQDATADFEEEEVRNLRSNLAFKAKIQPIQDVELNSELGRDHRESVLMHTRDFAAAAAIEMNDRLIAVGETLQVVRRSDNPASLHVEFGCMKIIPGLDT